MQLKRIFAILLAATLIFSVAAVPVSAETTEILKVGVVAQTTTPISKSPLIVNQGEEISVKVSVEENTGVNFLMFYLEFDVDAFEYVSHTSTNLLGNASINVEFLALGYIKFTLIGSSISTEIGELFEVTFAAKETCTDAQFAAVLDREADCCILGEGASKTNVPFVGDAADISVHAINAAEGVVTDPTCTEDGYTTYQCSCCEQAVVGNIVDALGHLPGRYVVENVVDANCTETGSYDEVQYCDRCFCELSRNPVTVPAFGHTAGDAVEENRVEATCTVDGSYDMVVYCTVCGEELSRETYAIPATGHNPGRYAIENLIGATCTSEGSYDEVQYCDTCRCELSRTPVVVPAFGHVFGETIVYAPTASSEGYSEKICQNCGYSEKFDFVPALNYTISGTITSYLVDGDITIQLFKDGEVVYTAIVNGTVVSYSIENVAAGTYTMVVSKENHISRSYEIVVGEEDVTADAEICPKGDITGDGIVNVKDFQRLLRHVNKTNSLEDYALECGDVTGDGIVNVKDFQRMLRHINKTNPLY